MSIWSRGSSLAAQFLEAPASRGARRGNPESGTQLRLWRRRKRYGTPAGRIDVAVPNRLPTATAVDPRMKKTRRQEFETYNHRIVWAAGEKNLKLATQPCEDGKLFALGAMFLLFAAFEGYLNWLGSRVAPEVWEDERRFFSLSPYHGTLGKYRFLCKVLCLPNPDPSGGAFQTAVDVLKLRDMVAHPKPEAGTRSVSFRNGCSPPHYQSKLAKRVSPERAKRVRKHLKKLAEELHLGARHAYPQLVFEEEAFGPILATAVTDV